MATRGASSRFNVSLAAERLAAQFRDLDPNQPGQWPLLPKLVAWGMLALVVVVIGWTLVLSEAHDELETARAREPVLKQDYQRKLAQAVNLSELRAQKLRVQEYVTQLERQLPGKAEMDALLSDINQAGLGRGLQFELFRPGQVSVRDYYAELPISIRVAGRYHDIGAFTADIANLSRIVTLHDMNITGAREPGAPLTMEATARTYRYLDAAELEEQRRAASAARAALKK